MTRGRLRGAMRRGRRLRWTSAVIYELHVGTFTPEGTFDSAIERLDYLEELGITHVELMPVAAFPGGHGWGYDGVALFAAAEQYGGPDGLKRLVDACHARGLAVLLDVVYNHFGPVGNYSGKFGPYITEKHRTPWGGAMNFEGWGSDEVRRFFCDNALMWMRDYHFDGLRLDAVHEYVDRSAIHFMEQLASEVDAMRREDWPAAGADRRERSERSAGGEAEGGWRLWNGCAVERRFPSCAVHGAAERRRREGILRRLRDDGEAGEGVDEVFVLGWDDVLDVPRTQPWAAGGRAFAAPVSWVYPEPRPDREQGGWGQDRSDRRDGSREGCGWIWC